MCQSINEGLKRESIAQFFKTEYNGFKYFLNDQNHPEKNIVSVIPELTYEAERAEGNPRIDLVIFINGFPLITIELKKTDSGATFTYSGKEYQPNYKAAIAQYRYDRNQNNLLFSNRVMANFAMDEYEVYKNDKLEGELSKFLPFNKDYKKPNSDFFYKEFLTKENIINLIDNYYYQTKDK
ncbi:hypothetical protein FACS189459_2390 [Bacilli bacterium]|nr:hypothetical protein FACS189459_2390 [Bacilli bacterium]